MNSCVRWLEKAAAKEYSATLTGNPFLFHESRLVSKFLLSEMPIDAIRDRIINENLFGYRSTKSVPKRVNALFQRLSGIPPQLLHTINSAPPSNARLVLLLLLAVRDRLFREFMLEVIVPCYNIPDEAVTDSDFRRFFETKAQIHPKVERWTDPVKTKLRTVFIAALVESGILSDRRERKIIKPILDPDLLAFIKEWFTPDYVQLLVGR